jgi:hypothetical protein
MYLCAHTQRERKKEREGGGPKDYYDNADEKAGGRDHLWSMQKKANVT